jgi:hypothetical protein
MTSPTMAKAAADGDLPVGDPFGDLSGRERVRGVPLRHNA